jgi:hypothetical protein
MAIRQPLGIEDYSFDFLSIGRTNYTCKSYREFERGNATYTFTSEVSKFASVKSKNRFSTSAS